MASQAAQIIIKMTSEENNDTQLQPYLIKQLLEDLENSGQSRDQCNFLSICNQYPRNYGAAGSKVRRLLQKKFQKVKEKPLDKYLSYLRLHGVNPGFQTQLAQTEEESKGDTAEEEDDDCSSSGSKMFSNDDDDNLANSFEHLSVVATPPRQPLPPTPPRPSISVSSTPSISLLGKIQNGTKQHPYVMHVDLAYPERNQEFCIERVSSICHNSYSRKGLHIRRAVPVSDFDRWEAYIPNGYPAELDFRLVLIKGPSQNFWLRDSERYHKKLNCDATLNAHKATEIEIENDESRQNSYWLLVFPKDVVLDNQIFSGDANNVDADWNDQRVNSNENKSGKELYGIVMMWKIGEIGGRRITKGSRKPDVMKLFT
jgi:hypothetical protein